MTKEALQLDLEKCGNPEIESVRATWEIIKRQRGFDNLPLINTTASQVWKTNFVFQLVLSKQAKQLQLNVRFFYISMSY